MPVAKRASRVSVTINPNTPRKQTLEQINKLVALAAGRAGCDGCGRIAYLDLGFLIDPGPDFEKFGAISVDIEQR